ncbi:Orotidine 5-phosphate decarboxylase [Lactobacillus equicursoris DSM 19284 = JCM 14600 = CIP 110162]|jgi:orotidine-5'-phosphate decarboxylase|uniref:Orotidine 5'-phosphate decarboxylase n=3 Tax=Lactobacillus equicursoris TaxID=420645 RepID=K0NVR3_9LACO|nr:orotidine-5'-phosphate decarboxylase [Lactobacillus equicursoris]KRL02540.1 orotidine 5-phosphate decarboxylase [Lactobacillus equicursoris DSM 19284 = JCM 14600 = CIP 110162]MST79847.1 orotidine-5'-phosphate decarboxylase [Lactobacillus equicursoris]CCK84105.1 Orotidine 5-phosphate decarboxylase [Lactobacillus equicursoris 66c]CCK84751.1 Orotidine 5-phosphate decarboxylase [Lactobacillus equicursoris DSM 19284 = JCM 14600 = CIP 110162]
MSKPLFIALDFDDQEKMWLFLNQLQPQSKLHVKLGMEMFYQYGPEIVRDLSAKGYQIFLDLKLHDIPNTVKRTARQLAALGVYCTTVHALGGKEMIKAAKEGLIEGTPEGKEVPKLLAVTELTSISEDVLRDEQHCSLSLADEVKSLAHQAQTAGADGIICSPLEVKAMKNEFSDDFMFVTPGIRPASYKKDDQARVATPSQARENGSTAIVVGRPITQAENPQVAYEEILKDWTK